MFTQAARPPAKERFLNPAVEGVLAAAIPTHRPHPQLATEYNGSSRGGEPAEVQADEKQLRIS